MVKRKRVKKRKSQEISSIRLEMSYNKDVTERKRKKEFTIYYV